jgi:hypothetical protein
MNIEELEYEGVDWIHLAQNSDHCWAVVNTVMNSWVSQKTGNFLTS